MVCPKWIDSSTIQQRLHRRFLSTGLPGPAILAAARPGFPSALLSWPQQAVALSAEQAANTVTTMADRPLFPAARDRTGVDLLRVARARTHTYTHTHTHTK